jgi:hypothetical protein
VARFKEIQKLQDEDPAAASDAALRLADESERLAENAISHWHMQQALGLAADIYLDSKRDVDASKALEKLARIHRGEMNGHATSSAQNLAHASVLLFKLGDCEQGAKLAREALQLFGQFPEPNPFLIDALDAWKRWLAAKRTS